MINMKNEIKREAALQGLLLLFTGFFTFASALYDNT